MITCPCCHRPMEGHTAPLEVLSEVPARGQVRRVLTALCEAYPRTTTSKAIADDLYASDPDGGPMDPLDAVHTIIRKLRKRLPEYGWTISDGKQQGTKGRYRLEPAGAMRKEIK